MIRNVVLLLCILLAVFPLRGKTTDKSSWKRYALIVGANDGGPERTRLRYAVNDADALRQVLEDLGGADEEGTLYLPDPNGDTFFSAFHELSRKIEKEKGLHSRTEFIFYYSGHSDERHILFSRERIPYSAVRSAIDTMATDVRIVILDSCASGAFTQTKGGKKRAPFMLDKAYDMKGFAFMSSSSSDEVSQESERLKGSFFTHNLVAGLRGAADMNQDGRITLTEAYQYTFDHTLSQTANTISGPQHPHKNIQMEGTGDVVITDIRRSPYRLIFDKDVHGTLLLSNSRGQLVIELHKSFGREMEIGLEPDIYRIINIRNNHYYESRIQLRDETPRILSAARFSPIQPVPTASRGDLPPDPLNAYAKENPPLPVSDPFRFTLIDIPDRRLRSDQFLMHLLLAYSGRLQGVSLGSGLHVVSGPVNGAQISAVANTVGGDMRYLQLSGLFNSVSGHTRGLQASGVLNYTRKSTSGIQLGGTINISGSLKGAQLGGGVNYVGDELTGVQIGLVNFAKTVRGLQVGLVNIATQQSDLSLGLFSYSPGNEVALSFCTDDARFTTMAVKTGNRRCYNLYMTGMDFSASQNSLGIGWGVHAFSGKSLGLDLDISSRLIFDKESFYGGRSGNLAALRSTLLFKLGQSFRIGIGASVNHYHALELSWTHVTDEYGNNIYRPSYPMPSDTYLGYKFNQEKENQMWVGLHLGVELVIRHRH